MDLFSVPCPPGKCKDGKSKQRNFKDECICLADCKPGTVRRKMKKRIACVSATSKPRVAKSLRLSAFMKKSKGKAAFMTGKSKGKAAFMTGKSKGKASAKLNRHEMRTRIYSIRNKLRAQNKTTKQIRSTLKKMFKKEGNYERFKSMIKRASRRNEDDSPYYPEVPPPYEGTPIDVSADKIESPAPRESTKQKKMKHGYEVDDFVASEDDDENENFKNDKDFLEVKEGYKSKLGSVLKNSMRFDETDNTLDRIDSTGQKITYECTPISAKSPGKHTTAKSPSKPIPFAIPELHEATKIQVPDVPVVPVETNAIYNPNPLNKHKKKIAPQLISNPFAKIDIPV